MTIGLHRLYRREKNHRPRIERNDWRPFARVSAERASRAVASGDLRPDVDPMDLLRAIYGLSTAGSAEAWPAKARTFVDILLQGSHP